FGMPVIEAIAKHAKKPLDTHLMIVDPDRYIKTFAALGVHHLTVHYEACPHLHRTLQAIKAEGMKAGVALNPHTPVHLLEDIIQDIDIVIQTRVNPGFRGPSFIEKTNQKIRELKRMIVHNHTKALLEIDGGANAGNAAKPTSAGAAILVAASFVFKSQDPLA